MANCGRGIFDSTGQEIQGMDDVVSFGHCWLREIVMEKFDSVGEEEGFGGTVDNLEAEVVVYRRSNVETVAAAEVPRLSDVQLDVIDEGTFESSNRGGIEVEQAVEVSPL